MTISSISEEKFEQTVQNSELPVLIDFWAEWCGPCKAIGPILEELSDQYSDSINIYKVNVDENQKIAMDYSIRSIPTLIILQAGSVKAQHVGAASKGQIENFITTNI